MVSTVAWNVRQKSTGFSVLLNVRRVQRHIARHYHHGPLCCVVVSMRCITNHPREGDDILGAVCHRVTMIRLQFLRQIYWEMLQHNIKHATTIVLPIFYVLRPFVVVLYVHDELHAITQGLDFVLPVLNGLIFIIIESFWDYRFCRFIVHRLSESLKCHRGVGSITPGLGSKVFAQFLFTNSNLAASFVLPIVDTWSSNPTVGDQYSVVLGAGSGSVAAGRLARRC